MILIFNNKYIIKSCDIKDELISPIVVAKDVTLPDLTIQNEYLDEMTEYISDFIYNIAGISLEELPEPAPYKLRQLAIVYVCKEICLRKSFSGGNAYRTQNNDTSDRWAQKLTYFLSLFKTLESQITPELLKGKRSGILGVSLERA